MRHTKSHPNRLYRTDDKVIAGVCAGIGEYVSLDPTIIRLAFILLTIFGGSGIIIYLILWAVIPAKLDLTINSADAMRGNFKEMKVQLRKAADTFTHASSGKNSPIIAVILIIIGAIFLFQNIDLFRFDAERFWPFILILVGILFLRKR